MNPHLLSKLPKTGIYTLIIHLPESLHLKVGKLGKHWFPKGYYAYTGSATGKGTTSLRKRVARHLQKKKRRFWHIDYLLSEKETSVTTIIAVQTKERTECKLNKQLKNKTPAKIPVLGFGASDCKKNCGSHLLYLGDKNFKHEIASIYKKFGSKTVVFDSAKISNLPLLNNVIERAALVDHCPKRKPKRFRKAL